MNAILTAIKLLGGLAMFLYGMEIMGDGLKQGSGNALKNILGKLTHNVFIGLLTGALVTAVIQSSTATIVLTVGLIGAGILNLRQAVSIVLGANIGTTVTAQIIRLMDIDSSSGSILSFFKPDTLAPIALIIGIILIMFIKKEASKNVGTIALGFGILFTGLMSMTAAVEPLSESEAFVSVLSYFRDMPLLGIVTGLVLTVIVQSSSAMVGILQAMSSTGLMTFNLIYPIIMGINLGTCITTALVCSIGSSKDAKRTGVVHIVFNTIGTILFMIGMTVIQKMGGFPDLWGSVVDSGGIANFQTLFNLVTAVVLLPFTGVLVNIACRVVKDDVVQTDIYPEMAALDRKLMTVPTVALNEVANSVVIVAKVAKENIERSLLQLVEYTDKRSEEILASEDRLDQFTDSVDNYLIELSGNIETESDNRQRNMLMQCVHDIERIGDYATNFDEMSKKLHDSDIHFSEEARKEMDILGNAVEEILRLTVEALEKDDDSIARRIEPLEEVIDDMVLLLKDRHTERLCQGGCSIDSGLIFQEALTYFERAADQCSSIAMLMLGKHNVEIMKNHHLYLQELHASGDQSYVAEQENRRAQYLAPLQNM
ncbi:Na/Pi cotransporter family protein [Frisingicoccus sp.]|uniref:Na/Pi cotransporter family protein n=1 Tax=Frisingicoccus sp. TaxID=1918627 RepID=UPI0025BF8CAA|nr:Na/Pi cotransporter family protein [Frisingicoccus sp.]